MALLLNWFKVELLPSTFKLPTKDFPSWEQSTAALSSEELQPFSMYRGRTFEDNISIVLLNGPASPAGWQSRTYRLESEAHVIYDIIKRAFEQNFRQAGLKTIRSVWGVTATQPVQEFTNVGIQLSCGVSCRPYHPDGEQGLGLAIQWEVKAEFVRSLADDQLRRMAAGLPVILRYDAREWKPDDAAKRFRNRFLGTVRRVISADSIEVLCSDNSIRRFPADKLFLEAKPNSIREYERRNAVGDEGRSVWRRIQELNHVLTSAGRRNTSVLQDRLKSIRRFLSPRGSDVLVVELPVFGGGQASLDLRATVVKGESQ